MNLYVKARVKWYFVAAGEGIRRHWQWVVLIVGFFFMVIDFKALASPIGSLGNARDFSTGGLYALWVFHCLGVVWIMMQRHAATGGIMAEYARTLPVPMRLDWQALLINLVIANTFFWIYLLLVVSLGAGQGGSLQTAVITLNAALLLLLTQAYWLAGKFWIVPLTMVFDYLLVTVSSALANTAAQQVHFLLAVALLVMMAFPVRLKGLSETVPFAKRITGLASQGMAFVPLFILVQHYALLKINFIQTGIRWSISAGMVTFTWAVVEIGENHHLTESLLLITGSLVALVNSGLFRILFNTHNPYQEYFRTLPVSSGYFALRDYCYISLLIGSVMLPIAIKFTTAGYIDIAQFLLVGGNWLGLTVLLLWANKISPQHGVALSSLITLIWSALAMSL